MAITVPVMHGSKLSWSSKRCSTRGRVGTPQVSLGLGCVGLHMLRACEALYQILASSADLEHRRSLLVTQV